MLFPFEHNRIAAPKKPDLFQTSFFPEEKKKETPTPTPRSPRVKLERALTIKEDPSFANAYRKAKEKLQAMTEEGASASELQAQKMAVQTAYDRWQKHQQKIKKGPKRDPRWTSIEGLNQAALEYLEKVGGAEKYVNWYDRHREWVESRFGADREWGGGPEVFYAFLAATSPNTRVEANVQLARKAYNSWKDARMRGRPISFESYIRSHRDNLYRAVEGEQLSGPKVNPFSKALQGVESEAVVDLWMGRLLYGSDKPTPKQIQHAQKVIRTIAEKNGWDIHYTQGLLWEMIRTHWGEAPADFLKALRAKFSGEKQLPLFREEGSVSASRKADREMPFHEKVADRITQMIREAQLEPHHRLGPPCPKCHAPSHQVRSTQGDSKCNACGHTFNSGNKRTSSVKSLGDLPEKPKDLIHVGDHLHVVDIDGVETEGIVDRVSRYHVWLRQHPRVIRKKLSLDGLDWRERDRWLKFSLRKRGKNSPLIFKKKARVALYQSIPLEDSMGGFEWLSPALEEVRFRKEKNEPRKRKANTDLSDDESEKVMQGRVNNFDDLFLDLTFSTNHLSRSEAWKEIWSILRKQFPGLNEEDQMYWKRRWLVLRKRTASGRISMF